MNCPACDKATTASTARGPKFEYLQFGNARIGLIACPVHAAKLKKALDQWLDWQAKHKDEAVDELLDRLKNGVGNIRELCREITEQLDGVKRHI